MDVDNNRKCEYIAYFTEKIISTIMNNYYYEVDYDTLYHAAIRGIVDVLDKYSDYYYSDAIQNSNYQYKNSREDESELVDLYFHEIKGFEMSKRLYKTKIIKNLHFNDNSISEFKELITRLAKNNITTLVLDLRDNIGGYVTSAVELCNLLIEDRLLFMSVDKQNEKKLYYSRLKKTLFDNVIVLTNTKTMSAAEAVTAAMKSAGNIVIGEKTFGKGISQRNFTMPKGEVLKLTIAEYFTSSGEKINNIGVSPDIFIEDRRIDDEDLILQKTYDYLMLIADGGEYERSI